MTELDFRALQYVRNTGGGATKEIFIEDHEPIGERVYAKLLGYGLIYRGFSGSIFLTDAGKELLNPKTFEQKHPVVVDGWRANL